MAVSDIYTSIYSESRDQEPDSKHTSIYIVRAETVSALIESGIWHHGIYRCIYEIKRNGSMR